MESVSELREAVVRSRPRTPNLGYPEEVRARVARFARARRATGEGWQQIGDLLGLSRSVVRLWAERDQATENGFVPVSLMPTPAAPPEVSRGGGLELTSPRGYRVTGLDLEGVATLLSRLG